MNARAPKINHLDQMIHSCNGSCSRDAQTLIDAAASTLKPQIPMPALRDIDKRFKLLSEMAEEDAHTQAELALEYTLALYEAAYGPQHSSIAKLLRMLSHTYRAHNKEENAALLDNWVQELEQFENDPVKEEDTFFKLFGMTEEAVLSDVPVE